MTRDEELWGAALAIERLHGPDADTYVAQRVTSAATAGDEAGVSLMMSIAERLEALRVGKGAA